MELAAKNNVYSCTLFKEINCDWPFHVPEKSQPNLSFLITAPGIKTFPSFGSIVGQTDKPSKRRKTLNYKRTTSLL